MEESILDKAIAFASTAHRGAKRKSGTPFILHPLEDAAIIATMSDDIELMAAGVLHDTIEDTDVTYGDILREFGKNIADLVQHETENKRPEISPEESWKIRKQESLEVLRDTDDIRVKILWLADKLSNLRGLYNEVLTLGENAFEMFNEKDPAEQKWYYNAVAEYTTALKDTMAYKEYVILLNQIFKDV